MVFNGLQNCKRRTAGFSSRFQGFLGMPILPYQGFSKLWTMWSFPLPLNWNRTVLGRWTVSHVQWCSRGTVMMQPERAAQRPTFAKKC